MHGVINLNKPRGLTSQDAVTLVKRILGAAKAGHAGTLDPIATGVLLVCLGEATKISSLLMDMPKEYLATLKLGQCTDTFDADGNVVEQKAFSHVTLPAIEQALGAFKGIIMQRPPMFSAVKVGGRPLYKLARKGVEVERPSREVTVHSITVEGFELPYITLRVGCSKGFYVRSFADDLGRALGTVAHLTGLVRTAVGRFRVENAVRPEDSSALQRALVSIDGALTHIKEVLLSPDDHRKLANGVKVVALPYGKFSPSEVLRLKGPSGSLFAIGEASEGFLRVRRGLNL